MPQYPKERRYWDENLRGKTLKTTGEGIRWETILKQTNKLNKENTKD